jgi:hypothetical protein
MPNALDKPGTLNNSREYVTPSQSVAAVREIFDFLEDFFIFADAFNSQLNAPQKIVYQRFCSTSASFRHDMLIASRITPPAIRELRQLDPNEAGQ